MLAERLTAKTAESLGVKVPEVYTVLSSPDDLPSFNDRLPISNRSRVFQQECVSP